MSRRDRIRRRRNGAAGTNGSATTGSNGKNGTGPHPVVADAAPPATRDDGANAGGPFDVEVPIDLGTELLLAAAVSKAAAARNGAPSERDARGSSTSWPAPPSTVDQIKLDVRRRLIELLDLEPVESVADQGQLAMRIRETGARLLRAENAPLSAAEREEVIQQVVEELTGLGPIEPLFRDPTITDILVNGAKEILVERGGRLSRHDACFRDDAHLLAVIGRVVSRAGQRIDESSPMVDARLPDGSRVSAIVPPLALDGPVLSIRRAASGLSIEALGASGTLTRPMATVLAGCVHARLNILISGGAGSGKTTLLNALSAFIPGAERVVTVEDSAELRLRQEHVVRLETGRLAIEARDVVRNALRMRPNRIILGELRGAEAADLLQAMSTGHEGSMATIHANSTRDALSRLESMASLACSGLAGPVLREQIAATIDVVVQIARLADGRRRVVSIAEVTGVDGDRDVITNEIFTFRRSGVVGGRSLGRSEATGARPRFLERLEAAGVLLPTSLFDEPPVDADDATGCADEAIPRRVASPADSAPITSPNDVGGPEERHARVVGELESTVRALEAALEQEKEAARAARGAVEEMRQQVLAARIALDDLRDEVRAAQHDAEEHRELQATLQHRSRALAVAVMGFVEILDDVIGAGRVSSDEAMRTQAWRLRESGGRLLALFGLSEINGVGAPLDESQHEVVRRVPPSRHAPGTVVAVVRRGFAYYGQTVRRAQVVAAG